LGHVIAVATLLIVQQAQGAPLTEPPAPDTRSVVVLPPMCKAEAFPLAPLLDCLRVELAGRGLDCCTLAMPGEAMPNKPSLQVKVEIDPCASDGTRLQISARETDGSRMAERQVSLADVPETARPRTLALAVAELIRSLEQEQPVHSPEPLTVPAQDPVTTAPSPQSEGPRPIQLALHVDAEARANPMRELTLWGGRMRLTAHRQSLHADLDLGGNYAHAQTALGDIVLRSASAGIGFGPRLATGMAVIDLGLRAELGWAWIRGETTLSDVRTGEGSRLISSVGGRASVEFPAQVKVRPCLTLESGLMLQGLEGEAGGKPATGMTGYYLLAALGIAVSL
jgi:hypothetical protein